MIGFFIGVVITGISFSVLFGSMILEAEEKAYKKGFEDGKKKYSQRCEFGNCKHYFTCDKEKGAVCEEFEQCKSYMDAYDNNLELWQEIHDWRD